MGQAKRRGTREQRIEQALANGRAKPEPEIVVPGETVFAHHSDGESAVPMSILLAALAGGLKIRSLK